MDAGVPIKAPIAGIAMGLVKDDDRFTVLTDILGDEDHLGDMDFKVAGTSRGINALQMDIKIDGITEDIMSIALTQAKEARLNIIGQMNQVISEPNEASKNAPKTKVIKIPTDKIRDLIGKGGETIRGIISQSGASIDVDDDGNVNVFANDDESFEKAVQMVKDVTAVPEVGKVYTGKVAKIVEFGAFITIMPNQDGLLHVSEIAHERVNKERKLSVKLPVAFLTGTGRALYPLATGSNIALSKPWFNLNIALLKPSKHSLAEFCEPESFNSSLSVDPAITKFVCKNNAKIDIYMIFLII